MGHLLPEVLAHVPADRITADVWQQYIQDETVGTEAHYLSEAILPVERDIDNVSSFLEGRGNQETSRGTIIDHQHSWATHPWFGDVSHCFLIPQFTHILAGGIYVAPRFIVGDSFSSSRYPLRNNEVLFIKPLESYHMSSLDRACHAVLMTIKYQTV